MAEINDPDTLLAALSQLLARAVLEDLDAGLERRLVAENDLPLLRSAIANAHASGMSGAAVAAVERLIEPLNRLFTATYARTRGTAEMVAKAEAAKALAAGHVALQSQGAAGRFYQQRPPAAAHYATT